ncbi:hypothetical protein BDN70DRAFT_567418 [Pholiota conissans]|uniref:DEAD/DEAH-box helicase domain-containing protein n=1 Tax=Pholiota conissans TaxID=109636 RepID=A0A9P5YMX5_9AGAR|nr:hypothetical protein BDN70DRAFT_567418 [Pholiota conissans]
MDGTADPRLDNAEIRCDEHVGIKFKLLSPSTKQKDVIESAQAGGGKTMSFWIPVLMALEDGEDKMSIVVTPLNLLGKQNVDVP